MNETCDCAIIGAGFTGATLAAGLAQLGLRVIVIEARAPLAVTAGDTPDQRGLALAHASWKILSALGMWQPLAAEVTPIRSIHITERGRFGVTTLTAEDAGVDAMGYVCPALRLATVTERHLQDLAGVTRLAPARVTALELQPEGRRLVVEHGGQTCEISAKLVVAADGVDSATRDLLGIGAAVHDYQRSAVVANVSVARPQAFTAFERFDTAGPVALLPLGGRRYVSIWTMATSAASAMQAMPGDDYTQRLNEFFGTRLGTISEPGPRQVYPLRLVRANEIAAPRAVLIGNAANTVHPNASQGLNLGLRDVAALLEAVAVHGMQDAGCSDVIDVWREQRLPDHQATVRFSDTLARLFASDLAIAGLARHAVMLGVTAIPALKAKLVRNAMGLGGRPPRLARGARLIR
ncbi:MAG: FAD-dependent monooxygenase [Gammaproteobacteria bacterium]|nr:FAD-dependent monooxygenase [Gammaproteobacteria bacterium]